VYTPGYSITIPPMVSAYTQNIGWVTEVVSASAPASATWESAARAVYTPIVLRAPCVARRVWWANGATTTGGATVEVGIYANVDYGPGAKLVSGSATQGTASQVQFVDVTDTALPPGLYWIAVMCSSATNTTMFRVSVTADAMMRFEEASASPLPSTATPVESTVGNLWLCGFATTASP
jgi:hypothetical protein